MESAARFVACEKQRSCEAILQEKADTGCGDAWSMQGYPEPIRDADAAKGNSGTPEA